MAYIGSSPVIGEFKKLDDISGQFNDSNVIFSLRSGGVPIEAAIPTNLLISIDGVLQEPFSAYSLSGSDIVFTESPNASSTFFGVQLGSVNQIGVPSDLTVTTNKIVDSAVTTAKINNLSITTEKLAFAAVETEKIAEGNVVTASLAESAVVSSKIADGNVITSKIADDAITSSKLSPNLSFRGNSIFSGTVTYLGASVERANVIASNITSTVTIDNQNNGIVYYTGNSTSNADVTVDFINMDSVTSGNTASFVLMITNNADFQAYVGNVNINGASGNIVRWLGGVPTEGDANINVYSFSVVKTADSSYTTLASKNNFD